MESQSTYETEYTYHTFELLDAAWRETQLDLKIRYWNSQFHILIGERHVFCGNECECQAWLQAATTCHRYQRTNGVLV